MLEPQETTGCTATPEVMHSGSGYDEISVVDRKAAGKVDWDTCAGPRVRVQEG